MTRRSNSHYRIINIKITNKVPLNNALLFTVKVNNKLTTLGINFFNLPT
ncbi:hypothetical protein BPTFM16_02940 [Altererythrobacter insulae]|nr:hypothetical protein BPTFM16_02940 [Altererythrobacter insulae]